MIDSIGQFLRELGQELLARQSGLLLQFVERVRPKRLRELVRCQSPVLARADPGVHVLAIAALPELIEQTAQASSGKAAATEQPTAKQSTIPSGTKSRSGH